MDPDKKRRFEAVCRILGLREWEVLDQFFAEFLGKHENQAELSPYLGLPMSRSITIQADRVNVVARKANVLVVKEDPRRAISRLENPPRPNLERLLRDELSRVLQRAARLPPETRDKELRDLVAEAEASLASLIARGR